MSPYTKEYKYTRISDFFHNVAAYVEYGWNVNCSDFMPYVSYTATKKLDSGIIYTAIFRISIAAIKMDKNNFLKDYPNVNSEDLTGHLGRYRVLYSFIDKTKYRIEAPSTEDFSKTQEVKNRKAGLSEAFFKRQTGRTTAMVEEIVKDLILGEKIAVLVLNHHERKRISGLITACCKKNNKFVDLGGQLLIAIKDQDLIGFSYGRLYTDNAVTDALLQKGFPIQYDIHKSKSVQETSKGFALPPEFQYRDLDIKFNGKYEEELEANPWFQTARQHCKNEEFYRGILEQIASIIGAAAYKDDFGKVVDSPVILKLPEVVKALKDEAAKVHYELDSIAKLATEIKIKATTATKQ